MHVIYIVSVGVLAYYLASSLPVDQVIVIPLSIGVGLWAAYGVYRASSNFTFASIDFEKEGSNNELFLEGTRSMDPAYSQEPGNTYFNNED